jgi:hypothetical protein
MRKQGGWKRKCLGRWRIRWRLWRRWGFNSTGIIISFNAPTAIDGRSCCQESKYTTSCSTLINERGMSHGNKHCTISIAKRNIAQ